MTITLYDALSLKYPQARFPEDIQLGDHGLGNGPEIVVWNLAGVTQPSAADIANIMADPKIQAACIFKQNRALNKPIYDQLQQLDLQSIRAIRTNDTVRMAQYEQQAVALRAKLLPVS